MVQGRGPPEEPNSTRPKTCRRQTRRGRRLWWNHQQTWQHHNSDIGEAWRGSMLCTRCVCGCAIVVGRWSPGCRWQGWPSILFVSLGRRFSIQVAMLCDVWFAIEIDMNDHIETTYRSRRHDVTENMLQQIFYLLQQIFYLLQQIFYLLQQIFYLLQQIFRTTQNFVRATLSPKLSELTYVEVCTQYDTYTPAGTGSSSNIMMSPGRFRICNTP